MVRIRPGAGFSTSPSLPVKGFASGETGRRAGTIKEDLAKPVRRATRQLRNDPEKMRSTIRWLKENKIDVVLVGMQYTVRLARDANNVA
jgi:hypothetical protein